MKYETMAPSRMFRNDIKQKFEPSAIYNLFICQSFCAGLDGAGVHGFNAVMVRRGSPQQFQ